jgi:RND family efflux transporter MFP subunit
MDGRTWLCAAVVFGAVVLAGCAPPANTYAPPAAPEVTVSHPIRRQVTDYLEYTGTTEAYETVDLRARVTGFLEQVLFKPGARVKRGDLLFVIDRRPFQATVSRLKAQILADEAVWKAAVWEAKTAEDLAGTRAGSEIDKIQKIGKRDSSAAAVEAAKAALESAMLDLEFCEVRAPIDGRITKNNVDVGNYVGAPGQLTTLATIVNSRPIYVSLDVSESDVLSVRRQRMSKDLRLEPGQITGGEWRPADLAIGASKLFDVHGHVDYVDPALNPQSATIHVRFRFENEDDFLLPGLFARVRVPLETIDTVVAPDIALLSDQGGRFAFVVNEKDVVEIRRVKIGQLDGAMRVVLDGLTLADRIVTNGLQRVRPGLTVKAVLREIASEAGGASTRSESRGPDETRAGSVAESRVGR